MDAMSRSRFRQPRLGIDRLQPHLPHQPPYALRIDRPATLSQPVGHPVDPIERPPRVLLVDASHQIEVLDALASSLVVKTLLAHVRQLALAHDAEWPVAFDPLAPLL